MRADAGVVISASHNPYQDNGIKFFSRDGFKLPDETELRIERLVLDGAGAGAADFRGLRPTANRIGKAKRVDDAIGRYVVFLKSLFPRELTLDGVTVVVDCGHGAAYQVAPAVLRGAGRQGDRAQRRARRQEHQPPVRRGPPRGDGARHPAPQGPPRPGARRRRRPGHPGRRAGPGGGRRRHHGAGGACPAGAQAAGQEDGGGHGDVQPGAGGGAGAAGRQGGADRGGRPRTWSRPCAATATTSAASSPATSSSSTTSPPATAWRRRSTCWR